MSLDINMLASIDHLNIRKQGPEDDQVLAIDVKMSAEVDAQPFANALAPDQPDKFLDAFFDGDGEPRFLALSEIQTWVDFSDHKVKIGSLHPVICDVKKIRFRCRGDRVLDVAYSVSIEEPSRSMIEYLAEQIRELVRVQINGQQEELDLGTSQEAA